MAAAAALVIIDVPKRLSPPGGWPLAVPHGDEVVDVAIVSPRL